MLSLKKMYKYILDDLKHQKTIFFDSKSFIQNNKSSEP